MRRKLSQTSSHPAPDAPLSTLADTPKEVHRDADADWDAHLLPRRELGETLQELELTLYSPTEITQSPLVIVEQSPSHLETGMATFTTFSRGSQDYTI